MTNPNGKHAIQVHRLERFVVSVPAGEDFKAVTVYTDPSDYERALLDAKERAAQFRRAQEEAQRCSS
jgi:hypothetical protein